MKLNILKVPNPVLKQKSKQVTVVDNEISVLIDNMFETMYENNGVGLAAIQVGIPLKIVVIDVADKDNKGKNQYALINPEIIWKSEDSELMDDGCLSVPQQYEKVMRNKEVEVKYFDKLMKEQRLKADGLLAHCLQHEIDHTNGILFVDYLSTFRKTMLKSKLRDIQKGAVEVEYVLAPKLK